MSVPEAGRRPRTVRASPWPFVGMAGLACTLFLYAVSGLVAPWWGVLGLVAVWLVIFAMGCRWWTRHPARVAVLPLVALAVWFAVVSAGGAWLGWNA